ncbi:MAG: fimbrial biosis outer rane usher protein [Chlamydiales bacterium]|nr:fimbrial biosis outer rane usher protein [Chlamydiales bacterium]
MLCKLSHIPYYAVVLLVFPLLADPNSSIEKEQLWKKAFGEKKKQQNYTLEIPIILDGVEAGFLQAFITGSSPQVEVELEPLLRAIQSKILPQFYQKIAGSSNSNGLVELTELCTQGLEASFDQRKLQLRITTLPKQRVISYISLVRRREQQALPPNIIYPAPISGYVNISAREQYTYRPQGVKARRREPLYSNFESAVNYRDWIVEGNFNYAENALQRRWQRDTTCLIHDDKEHLIRYALGDLSYPTMGFQGHPQIAGLSVSRNFSLKPHTVLEPSSQHELFLKTDSTVEVWANGTVVKVLQLPAGPHQITDFPLSNGLNDIQLVITDIYGRQEKVKLPFMHDAQLLAPGIHQFSYNLGVVSKNEERLRHYDSRQPVFSAYHRTGLSQTFTGGINFQQAKHFTLVGLEGMYAHPVGVFRLIQATSSRSQRGLGYATRLEYESYPIQTKQPHRWFSKTFSWNGAIEYQHPLFNSLESSQKRNTTKYRFTIGARQHLGHGIWGGISGFWSKNRNTSSINRGVSASLSKSWRNSGWSMSLSGNIKRGEKGKKEHEVMLTAMWSSPDHQHDLSYHRGMGAQTTQVDWNYRPKEAKGVQHIHANFSRSKSHDRLTGNIHYTANRFESNLSHYLVDQRINTNSKQPRQSHISNLSASTAIVFAGNHFALSRPVHSNFLLAKPHSNLKGQFIGLNPNSYNDQYAAVIDYWGPAVIPSLSPYTVQHITAEAPQLPIGYDLGTTHFPVYPTYKSGTLVTIGTESTIFLSATLLYHSGQPLENVSGQIIAKNNPQAKSIRFFTNRRGKFRALGLYPGEFQMILAGAENTPISFTIPKSVQGLYDLGAIKLPPFSN